MEKEDKQNVREERSTVLYGETVFSDGRFPVNSISKPELGISQLLRVSLDLWDVSQTNPLFSHSLMFSLLYLKSLYFSLPNLIKTFKEL